MNRTHTVFLRYLLVGSIALTAAACGLLYTPDFTDKFISADSTTNSGQANPADGLIVPGDATLTGKASGAVKLSKITFSIDGGAESDGETSGGDWTIKLNITKPGRHTLTVHSTDAADNKSDKDVTLDVPAYVATTGSDANNGATPTTPKAGIQTAITNLKSFSPAYVYIGAGDYNQQTLGEIFLTNVQNISLIGGYNSSFSGIVGFSRVYNKSVAISNIDGLIIKNLWIDHMNVSGYSPVTFLNIRNGSLENVLFTTNSCNGASGGALGLIRCSNITIGGDFISNYAAVDGGAIYCFSSSNITVTANVAQNNADDSGGGVYITGGMNNTISGSVSYNTFAISGGGVFITDSDNNTISGTISYNTNPGSGYGGGVYLYGGKDNRITASIISNRMSGSGFAAGIYIEDSTNYTISGDVIGNTGSSIGGGFYILQSSGRIINNHIIGNFAYGHAGGIYILNLTNALDYLYVVSSVITNNYGGGGSDSVITVQSCTNMRGLMFSNCIIGGTNNNCLYGINEYGAINTVNQVLVDNVFIIQQLSNCYRDLSLGKTNSAAALNDPNYSGAAEAHGNRVQ